jgi:ssDNA-binding Zn-finger/Zn-ribbon topoisomerase 1
MHKRVKFDLKQGDQCPYCKIGTIVIRTGKFGDFFACNQYPRCAFIQQIKEDNGNPLDLAADAFLAAHGINMPRI